MRRGLPGSQLRAQISGYIHVCLDRLVVRRADTILQLLHAVYAKAVEQIDRPKRKDPLQTLPLEVVQMILGRLEFTDIW